MEHFDVIVIGGGPGGYQAAIRLSQYGMRTALVEQGQLGGTCLNRGCIPTKALLHASAAYAGLGELGPLGVQVADAGYDYAKVAEYKDSVVLKLRSGVEALEKAHGVQVIRGRGRLVGPHTVQVGADEYSADKLIIATGSRPAKPPVPGLDSPLALTSDDVLAWQQLPLSVVLIGGGVIGVEFATFLNRFGVKTTIIELEPALLPGQDTEVQTLVTRALKRSKIELICAATLSSVSFDAAGAALSYQQRGEEKTARAACCVVTAGRRPNTADLGLEHLGIALERGYIATDQWMRTALPHIYAIGDITPHPQLAHVAEVQAMVAAAHIANRDEAGMDYSAIPACVYGEPELATVGLSAAQAEAAGYAVLVGRASAAANGKSVLSGAGNGLVKLVAEQKSGRLLGAQLLCERATDIIGELAVAVRHGLSVDQLAATVHPHPTVCEMVLEAAHDIHGLSCNAPPKQQEAR